MKKKRRRRVGGESELEKQGRQWEQRRPAWIHPQYPIKDSETKSTMGAKEAGVDRHPIYPTRLARRIRKQSESVSLEKCSDEKEKEYDG